MRGTPPVFFFYIGVLSSGIISKSKHPSEEMNVQMRFRILTIEDFEIYQSRLKKKTPKTYYGYNAAAVNNENQIPLPFFDAQLQLKLAEVIREK